MHTDEPLYCVKDPGEHDKHVLDPSTGEYDPGVHTIQTDDPSS